MLMYKNYILHNVKIYFNILYLFNHERTQSSIKMLSVEYITDCALAVFFFSKKLICLVLISSIRYCVVEVNIYSQIAITQGA